MKNSLPPTNEVELTASSPQEAQIQEYKSTLVEPTQGSDLGGQIIAMIQKELFQQPQQQTSDTVEGLTDAQTDEKRTQTDTLIQSEEKLDSSLSVRKLSPSVRIDEPGSSSALSIDSRMPPLIREETDALQDFLSSLSITTDDLQRLDIDEKSLRQLFQQEMACTAELKWSRFEQLIDNALHGLLLSRSDLQMEDKKTCLSPRVRPHEYSILLRRRSVLRKTYAASELVDGIRLGLLSFVRLFITSMLLYRLGSWASSGQRDFSAFENIFISNNQKGIDSLTGLLAKLNPSILRFMLTSPLILGAVQSLLEFTTANQDSQEKIVQRIGVLAAYLVKNPGWRSDVIRESIPIFSHFISVSRQIQKLAQSLNWNGKLTLEERQNAFAMIRQIAEHGRKFPQWAAMDVLARLAQGIGFKDFPLLQAAGYEKALLVQLLSVKADAFKDLMSLSQQRPEESTFKSAPRRLYASYLLWWLGQSTSWWRQRLPFFSLKVGILALEIYFLYNIVNSLVKAIHCPDKPGFQLGEGYLPWASDYSSTCFTRRMLLFYQIPYLQTVQQLVVEIPRYHLADFIHLDLSSKLITGNDAQSIIQAVIAQGAQLQYLNLGSNALNELPLGFFAGLSQLQYLDLSNTQITDLSPGIFSGLNQLQSLSLSNNPLGQLPSGIFSDVSHLQFLDLSSAQISNLSSDIFRDLTQLEFLTLYSNPMGSLPPDVFYSLTQLQHLDLSWTQLNNLSTGTFNGLGQLRSLNLVGNFLTGLSSGLLTNLSQLQSLDLCGNLFNTSAITAILFSSPTTLIALNISNNAMIDLPGNMLSLWPSALRVLTVGGNPFIPTTLSSAWMNYFPIQLTDFSLGASYCIINISTGTFASFGQLRSLNLSYNLLSHWLPSTLLGLSQLQNLDLSENLFTALPSGTFTGLSQLQSLILTGNPIHNLSVDAFSGLFQLQQLDLSATFLSDLPPNVFMSLTQLQSLSITNNPWLFNLPSGLLSNLSQLQFLDLSSNNLTSLPSGLFTNSGQLQLLNLSSNPINYLPSGIYTGLRQLKIFNDFGYGGEDIDLVNNFSVNFPYQITQYICPVPSFSSYVSAEGFLNFFPCLTQLESVVFAGDILGPISKLNISVLLHLYNVVLEQLLKNVCEEQLCHANLPPQQLCHIEPISSSQTITPAAYSDRFLTFAQSPHRKTVVQSTRLTLSHFESSGGNFYFPNSSLTPVLSSDIAVLGDHPADDSFTGSLSTPITISATILGVAGLSILLYKNSTWIKAIVDTGCQFLQHCCQKAKPTSTTQRQFSPASTSPHYTVFTSVSSSVKKVFTSTISPEIIRGKSTSNHLSS